MRRRVAAVALVLASAIAACITALGETRQYDVVMALGPNPADFVATVGSSQFQMFKLGDGSGDTGDMLVPPVMASNPTTCAYFKPTNPDVGPFTGSSALVSNSCGAGTALPPGNVGGTCTYDFGITFTPPGPFSYDCDYTFQYCPVGSTCTGSGSGSGSGTALSTFTLVLHGTGSAASEMWSVAPSSMQFLDVKAGTNSTAQTVTITNTGMTSFTVGNPAVPGPFTATPQGPGNLGPGAAQKWAITCDATGQSSAGSVMTTMTFATTDGVLSAPVSLDCNWIVTNLAVNPTPVTFAPVLIGQAGGSNVTVTNMGTSGAMSCAISGGSDVTITNASPINCVGGGTLGNGASTTISLQYKPQAAQQFGPLTPELVVGVGSDVRHVGLVGTANTAAVATSPQSLDFGTVCAGANPSVLTVKAFAVTDGDFDLAATTQPLDSNVFSVVPTNPTDHLMANQANSVMFTATFTPPRSVATMTTFNDKFTVNGTIPANSNNTPSQDVKLTAIVVPAGQGTCPGGKDRETYYACSAGGAVGLSPIALALAFALRRRRR